MLLIVWSSKHYYLPNNTQKRKTKNTHTQTNAIKSHILFFVFSFFGVQVEGSRRQEPGPDRGARRGAQEERRGHREAKVQPRPRPGVRLGHPRCRRQDGWGTVRRRWTRLLSYFVPKYYRHAFGLNIRRTRTNDFSCFQIGVLLMLQYMIQKTSY